MNRKIEHIIGLLIVVLMLVAVAIRRDGTVLGQQVVDTDTVSSTLPTPSSETKHAALPSAQVCKQLEISDVNDLQEASSDSWVLSDGRVLYSSELLGQDIIGYAGNTPLFVLTKGKSILHVICGLHRESPGFFRKVQRRGLFNKWDGKTFEQAAKLQVDGVSGATFTSQAVIDNMKVLIPVMSHDKNGQLHPFFAIQLDGPQVVTLFACLCVLLFGIATATFLKGKRWRIVQLLLNLGVLGFWTGSFISLPLLIGWLSHGANIASGLVILLILILAVAMPFLGKKSYYCTYVCPFGAAQELMAYLGPKRWKIPSKVMKVLHYTRRGITMTLLLLMWTGITFDLINYEVFSAFLFDQASLFILVLAGVSLLLSLVVSRPYCRFACPTGQLLKWSEGKK